MSFSDKAKCSLRAKLMVVTNDGSLTLLLVFCIVLVGVILVVQNVDIKPVERRSLPPCEDALVIGITDVKSGGNFALETGKWQEWSTVQYEDGVGQSGVCNGLMEVWLW